MHWINMTLVTSVAVYKTYPGSVDDAAVSVRVGGEQIYYPEFRTEKQAEEFARALVNSDGWVEADFLNAIIKETP